MTTIVFKKLYFIAILFGILNVPVFAEFYRWVDDDGTIHYSDSMPPSKAQREQEVVNEHGRVVETISAPKSASELEEARKLAQLENEKARLKQEAEHRDRVLLAMYLSVEDIEFVRDERIDTVNSAIEITELRKKRFKNKLNDLDESEKKFKEAGQSTPPWLEKSRSHYKEQLANVNEILDIKKAERLSIKKRFANEINRYIELKQPSLAIQ